MVSPEPREFGNIPTNLVVGLEPLLEEGLQSMVERSADDLGVVLREKCVERYLASELQLVVVGDGAPLLEPVFKKDVVWKSERLDERFAEHITCIKTSTSTTFENTGTVSFRPSDPSLGQSERANMSLSNRSHSLKTSPLRSAEA